MKKTIFIFLSVISFITGFFHLSNVHLITGYSVYDNLSENIRYFVGANFIILSFLFFLASRDWTKYRTGILMSIEEFESGLSPVQTALRINNELKKSGYSVTGVDYRGDFSDTIKFESGDLNVRLKGRDEAKDLALALFEVSLMNDSGNVNNSRIYLSKYASNESHPKGFKREVYEFELKHGNELRKVLKSKTRSLKKQTTKRKKAV